MAEKKQRSKKRSYTCGKCQEKGHNARTCGKGARS